MSSPWNPERYARHARFVADLGAPAVALLAPRPGERILDLGCGDGALTERLVAAGAHVVGVDADRNMVAAARARGLDVRLMDGMALAFGPEFDAVFTNAALHWMPAPEKVSAGVWHALRPGGRYVGEFGGFGNLAAVRAGIRAVLMRRGHAVPPAETQYYPTVAAFRALLHDAGFTDVDAQLIPRPTPLPTGLEGWLATFRMGFLDNAGVPAAERAAVIADICAFLRPILADEAGQWSADYVRLRFRAFKPPAA
ncbi:MAG: class I SAM-dependent methyltransferase [Alphaproteobacteria bacterium]|nr:MAG: class I SAM-dependent methyltransferase [Alphaproteobacteria bacterium]